MAQPLPFLAALIGDMVGSRRSPDRAELQREMERVLEAVDRRLGGNATFTIGDEFQAAFPTLEQAFEASLQLHLRAGGLTRLRIGIGWGELTTTDPERFPFGQDGPCWWRARAAIESLDGPRLRVRTAVRTETPIDALANGYLVLRDSILGDLDDTDLVVAVGLLDGLSQTEIAGRLGVNKSSVSRRAGSHGILALMRARDVGAPPLGAA